jgi:hypothetical protein
MNRYVSVAAFIALVSALAACDRTTSPKGAMNATFELKSMNGASLPYSRTLGSTTLQVTSDVLTLRNDGTYEDLTTYAVPNGAALQTSTSTERGKYSISGGAITFIDQTHGSRYGGSIDGTTLTESVNGLTPVYERR